MPNAVVLCAKSFFGVHFRNDVTLIERHTENGLTWHKTMVDAVDKDLQPKDTFDVDIILWLGFFAYVVAAQATDGATLGKRAMRLRVVGPDGRPPGWKPALIRNLVIDGPWILFALVMGGVIWADAFFFNVPLLMIAAAMSGAIYLIMVVQIGVTAAKGHVGIHDRLAGTRVIRLPRSD